jgi:hypothetical protein
MAAVAEPKSDFMEEKTQRLQHIETSEDEKHPSELILLEEAYTSGHHPDPNHPLNLPR